MRLPFNDPQQQLAYSGCVAPIASFVIQFCSLELNLLREGPDEVLFFNLRTP